MRLVISMAILLVSVPLGHGHENPRHIDLGPLLLHVQTLSQNWSDKKSNWFYNVAQGSRLIPYGWFIHLEQPDSEQRFLATQHIQSLGYIREYHPPTIQTDYQSDSSKTFPMKVESEA